MVRKHFFLAGLLCLFVAPAPLTALTPCFALVQDAQGSDEAAEKLIAKLKSEQDKADVQTIKDLAAMRTRRALNGLIEVYGSMASIFMKREVVRVLNKFDGVADCEQPALQKLMDVATDSQEFELREAALDALGNCPAHGKDFLALIVKSPAEDSVREKAMRLHVRMATKEDLVWYQEIYKPKVDEKAEKEREKEIKEQKKKEKEEKKKKEKGKNDKPDDEAEPTKSKHAVNLNSIRALAFGSLANTLKSEALYEASEDGYFQIRQTALEELKLRKDRQLPEIALKMFKSLGDKAENRVYAARILAELQGTKMAPEFMDQASRVDAPVELRRGLAEILANFNDDTVNRDMVAKLGSGKGPEKLFHIYAVRLIKDERVDKGLVKLLQDRDEPVVIAAAKLLGERKYKDAVPALRKLYEKAKDKDIARAALGATAMIRQGDAAWIEELLAMTKSPDPEVRNLALIQLGNSADKSHLDALVAALEDPTWSVRLAALEALEAMRMKEAISAIIVRMQKEEGRMRDAFANVLWRLTGQPYQENAEGWNNWWKDAKDNFQILSDADLEKVRTGEEEWRLKQTTRVDTKFFGIRIISHRVIFIIDVSGSMEEGLLNDYQGKPGQKRMQVAITELMKCIKGLDSGALFNIVPFSSDVERWMDGSLAACNEKNRTSALAYVENLKAFGGTNLYGAVREAFTDKDVDTIFIMSDGEPSVGDVTEPGVIREHVKAWNENRKIVINTIGIGGQFDVLKWIAEDSGGTHVKFE